MPAKASGLQMAFALAPPLLLQLSDALRRGLHGGEKKKTKIGKHSGGKKKRKKKDREAVRRRKKEKTKAEKKKSKPEHQGKNKVEMRRH